MPSYMEKMGYDISEYGIESLPMGGGIDVTVAQHTNGYQTLANDGVYHKKYMISKIEKNSGEVIYEHKDETCSGIFQGNSNNYAKLVARRTFISYHDYIFK